LKSKLAWQYPFVAATTRAAKTSVSELRRRAADETDEEARWMFAPVWWFARRAAGADRPHPEVTAADIGTAHHRFLEHVSLSATRSETALAAEAQRLEREGRLTADEVAVLDVAALAAFWNSDVGLKIRGQSEFVRRELLFTARFAPSELDRIIHHQGESGMTDEFVVVQGIADLVVLLPEEIWLLDFKTDEVQPAEIGEKVKFYEPQLRVYALALERIYQRRVTGCWLHFLACGETTSVAVATEAPISESANREI